MAALILTLQSCFVHRKPPAGDLCPDCWMCNVDVEAMMGAPGEGIGAGHAIILHVKLAKVNGIISNDSTEKSFKRNSNAVTVTPSETIQNVKDAASNICMSKTCRGSKPIRSNYRNTKYRFFIKATKQIYHQTASKKESLMQSHNIFGPQMRLTINFQTSTIRFQCPPKVATQNTTRDIMSEDPSVWTWALKHKTGHIV
ncbi:hypothetical protein V6N13_092715 [Hibiscus sabdariffa]